MQEEVRPEKKRERKKKKEENGYCKNYSSSSVHQQLTLLYCLKTAKAKAAPQRVNQNQCARDRRRSQRASVGQPQENRCPFISPFRLVFCISLCHVTHSAAAQGQCKPRRRRSDHRESASGKNCSVAGDTVSQRPAMHVCITSLYPMPLLLQRSLSAALQLRVGLKAAHWPHSRGSLLSTAEGHGPAVKRVGCETMPGTQCALSWPLPPTLAACGLALAAPHERTCENSHDDTPGDSVPSTGLAVRRRGLPRRCTSSGPPLRITPHALPPRPTHTHTWNRCFPSMRQSTAPASKSWSALAFTTA